MKARSRHYKFRRIQSILRAKKKPRRNYCQDCDTDLADDHTGPCPSCGSRVIHFEDTCNDVITLAVGGKDEHTHPAIEKKLWIWGAAKTVSLGSLVIGFLVAGILGALAGVALNILVRALESRGTTLIIKTDRSEWAPGEEPQPARVTLWQRLYLFIRWTFWD